MNDSNSEPRFDPRHDAIYQRGYQQGRASSAAPLSDTVGGAGAQPLAPHEPVSAEPHAGEGPANSGVSDAGRIDQPGMPDAAEAVESQRNPYFLALWIIASVLIVAGVALEWRSVALADYGYTSAPGEVPLEAIIQQITWVVAPIMITVGALTIVALLFWRGVHWRPSGESARREPTTFRKLGPWS